ncbi:MAG TPA: DinB family protein [Usitatibacter sp.]|nr:DinB family protein [Usitatibacter sp.]
MNAADFPNLSFPEALERLGAMPSVLEAALAGATEAQLRLRAASDGFCLIEQACHLRDLEREGYAVRLERMLDQEHPELAGFEGDVVARERDYMAQEARGAARAFRLERERFLARARTLTSDEMRRTGSFMGRSITVCDLLAMMVDHDAGHRGEIAALVAAR